MRIFHIYNPTCQHCHHSLRGNYATCYKCDKGNEIYWKATILCYGVFMMALLIMVALIEKGWSFNPFL